MLDALARGDDSAVLSRRESKLSMAQYWIGDTDKAVKHQRMLRVGTVVVIGAILVAIVARKKRF